MLCSFILLLIMALSVALIFLIVFRGKMPTLPDFSSLFSRRTPDIVEMFETAEKEYKERSERLSKEMADLKAKIAKYESFVGRSTNTPSE